MNDRMRDFYMALARNCATMSRATRLQVGCIIVKTDNIISFSWNGTPAGWDNTCEDKEYMDPSAGGWLNPDEIVVTWPFEDSSGRYRLKTKPEVIHAERNALDKLARSHASGLGASLFVTHSPCVECAKSIYGAGIKTVYFQEDYRSLDGVYFLEKCGIDVVKLIK